MGIVRELFRLFFSESRKSTSLFDNDYVRKSRALLVSPDFLTISKDASLLGTQSSAGPDNHVQETRRGMQLAVLLAACYIHVTVNLGAEGEYRMTVKQSRNTCAHAS